MSEPETTSDKTRRILLGSILSQLEQLKIPIGAVLLVILLRPIIASDMLLGYGTIASTILIWMIFVAGFNLLLGYTGMLSFGHAMFLGLGMYSVAIGLRSFDLPFLAAAAIGILLTTAIAYTVGWLIVGRGEIYFAMLTIAFGQATYFIVNQNPAGLTNGSDGINGAVPGWIETYRGNQFLQMGGVSIDWYWLVGAIFILCVIVLWQIIRSPFGRTLIAIRENEALARAMGVDTRRYKIASFTFSAAFAAIAGILLEVNNQAAVLETLHWSVSGEAVMMSVLGGMGYFSGPFLGVFVWLFTEDYLTGFEVLHLPSPSVSIISIPLGDLLTHWQFLLGLLFLVIILTSPRTGLWGHLRTGVNMILSLVQRLQRRIQNTRK